jgi:cupin fold WbuC family metalloprotein
MNFTEFNEEVFYTNTPITCVDRKGLDFLRSKAAANQRKRARLCTHPDVENALHEMLIVHHSGLYVQPHKHIRKSESFHIIDGALAVVIFDDEGNINKVIHMGDLSTDLVFYYRLSEGIYHSVIPLSDTVVFHETTNGPFRREDMVLAPWAPEEEDEVEAEKYFKSIIPQLGSLADLI